jgi:ABC-2 type transport system permease protein
MIPALRMEWIKLRGLRSTWWTLAATVLSAAGIGAAVGAATKDGSGDLTNNVLAGVIPGLLLLGVLGVLTMTAEYSSGAIRTTLTALPNRRRLLAAKAAVFGAMAFGTGLAAAFVAFAAGTAALPATMHAPTLGQPGVLRAVVLAGLGLGLIGMFGLGLGAVIRHSAAALAVFVGVVFVVGQLILAIDASAVEYVPMAIVGDTLGVTRSAALPPWEGLGLLGLYAMITLCVGGRLLNRRDA